MGFRRHVIETSQARILAYLHVSHAGIYGFDHRVMSSADFATDLAAKYDVVVLPSGTTRSRMVEGLSPKQHGEKWRWAYGIGEDGWKELRRFVEGGGTLVAIGSAVATARSLLDLPIEPVLPEAPPRFGRFGSREEERPPVPAAEVERMFKDAFQSPAALMKTIDARVVAASNRDLKEMVREGSFRADLYHRLSVFTLQLPPLRQVKEDLTELVPLFIAEFNAKAGKQVRIVPDEAWKALQAHDWPGNVRELRNVIERCVLFADGPVLPTQWLQMPSQTPAAMASTATASESDGLFLPLDGSMALDDMDCYIIRTTLERYKGNVTAAARALGTTRETLRYRIRKYGLKETA